MDSTNVPSNSTQTQTWAAVLTAIAGTVAVIAKKRFGRKPSTAAARAPELQHGLEALHAKLDANHKEVVAAIGAQSSVVEKRLDALEAAVARIDERTKGKR